MLRRLSNPLGRKATRSGKIIRMISILDRFLPSDAPTTIIPVVSLRGFKGYRVLGVTKGRPWSVTLYGGNFYLVAIQGLEPTTHHLPLHVLNYLRAHLHVRNDHRSS